mmetsp:Transcript_25425/g.46765  ORF Transcript_25425/g.46765 Transcript_25425/m.46765 type:complete len:277 (-) Transcript_25425:392-1222(-)|eukprot:CAMPEP_0201994324 /NCGR_PEP_ID=MMETSP0905-20130828/2203_1 /ASSEMBLY_ACC=CAM_ASM_000554 /TAXON_ID=420261 /ORGANISM="Thalassiosira antarctica, Strain CCMP982" /LENGTH=276 /DNA_ID=CAMNT_0048549275 /DNA_START=113 /DNA_END=943 /DNA_ORIENTATION=+
MSKQSRGSDGSLGSDFEEEHEDEDERRHRNRERNKEHARKTRVRKKEHLQRLKARVAELEEESNRLQQGIQECSVASILLGLSAGTAEGTGKQNDEIICSASSPSSNFGVYLVGGKRKRFMSLDGEDPTPPPMELNIKGQITLVGGPGNEGKAQVNWKTGVYIDEQEKRQQLTKSELEALRRERNRMHAKMTRDRKKCFIASLKRVISKLEDENQQLRETLEQSRDDEIIQSSEEKKTGDLFPSPFSRSNNQNNTSHSMLSNTSPSMFNSHFYTVG